MDRERFRQGEQDDTYEDEQYTGRREQPRPRQSRSTPTSSSSPSSPRATPASRRERERRESYERREEHERRAEYNQQGRRRVARPGDPAGSRDLRESRGSRDTRGLREQREPRYSRDDVEDYYNEPRSPAPRRQPPRTTRRIYPDEEEGYAPRTRRPAARPSTQRSRYSEDDTYVRSSSRSRPHQRRRSALPSVIGGCLLGIGLVMLAIVGFVFFAGRLSQGHGLPGIGGIGGTKAFQQSTSQNITISALTQLQICNRIGSINVKVDQTVSTTTLTITKVVQATSQSNANQEFGNIGVSVQQPAGLPAGASCPTAATTTTPTSGTPASTPTSAAGTTGSTSGILTIQTSIPNSDSLLRATSDAVNLQLTLAPSALTGATTLPQFTINSSIGDINVSDLIGILNIHGNTGNVTATACKLINGSSIGTGEGNVTFKGSLASPQDTTTNASYIIRAEKGQVDVTLPGDNTTNVILSASTNVGAIHSDFPITPTGDGNSASYRGPLNSAAAIQSIAVLTLDVSTGNITIHKGT